MISAPIPSGLAGTPQWLMAHSQRSPLPLSHPQHPLPAEDFYRRLHSDISVSGSANEAIEGWLGIALERIVEAVGPHVMDVDARVCGSFATGLHVAGSSWDVDVALRLHSPELAWDGVASALADTKRWLHSHLAADVELVDGTLVISEFGAMRVRVILSWRTPDGWASSHGALQAHAHPPVNDPVSHRDLLLARERSLGDGSVMRPLIRLVKYLVHRWKGQHGWAPLSSFEIDNLALSYCMRPMLLTEAVPGFLSFAADACFTRERLSRNSVPASSLFASAAQATERALMTANPCVVDEILSDVFGTNEAGCDQHREVRRLHIATRYS
jgi:hypothetical protein